MSANRGKRRLAIRKPDARKPMPREDFAAAERLLARLVAECYFADCPELLRLQRVRPEQEDGDSDE